jgi:hypothetical protein
MRVSRSKENAMLSTVRMLRRLLRKAFFVTKRVKVIEEPLKETRTSDSEQPRPELAARILEFACHLQPIPFSLVAP